MVFSDGCGDEFHELIRRATPDSIALKIEKVQYADGPKSFRHQYEYLSEK